MLAIRVRFKKEGRAKYISHLDLNRCMQRALRRANIPVWRTQGFNPHPYIVFAMPLSIFYESDCEIMDARLDGEMTLDEAKTRLAAQMPEGIIVTDIVEPQMKISDIRFAEYSVSLDFDGRTADELNGALGTITALDEVMIEKSTKRSTVNINIKEYIESAKTEITDGAINIRTVLPAGNQSNLNPSCFVAAFEKYSFKPDFEHIRRIQIFNQDMQAFL